MIKNRPKKKKKSKNYNNKTELPLWLFGDIFFVPGESESSTLGHKINLTDD